MILRVVPSGINGRPGSDQLQKYHTETVDVAKRSQMKAGTICRVKVSRRPLDLTADMRLILDWP